MAAVPPARMTGGPRASKGRIQSPPPPVSGGYPVALSRWCWSGFIGDPLIYCPHCHSYLSGPPITHCKAFYGEQRLSIVCFKHVVVLSIVLHPLLIGRSRLVDPTAIIPVASRKEGGLYKFDVT